MQEILLIGGGGHCRSVIDVIEQENRYKIGGIIDKTESLENEVSGYKIIGNDEDLTNLRRYYKYAFVTVGHIYSNDTRIKLFLLLKKLNFTLPTIISPLSYVSSRATVAQGTIVMHQALVNAHVKIGENCIINSKALIEHDVVIEDNVHISTNVAINGGTYVKEGSFIGSGTTTKEGAILDGFIKAGSIVK